MRITLEQRRFCGMQTPRFYRVAYSCWDHDVCYPLGIHLLVRAGRRIWEWSHHYRHSAFERRIRQAYLFGRQSAQEDLERLTRRRMQETLDRMYGRYR